MCHLVEHEDGSHLNDVSYQEAIPYPFFSEPRNQPQHGDDRQRQGEGNEECHLVIVVKFIDNHDGVNVAEGNETNGKNTQRIAAFDNHLSLIGTK